VNFAATAAVGLEGAFRHDVCPVSNFEDVCWSLIAFANRR
jgi:hypothetical protein